MFVRADLARAQELVQHCLQLAEEQQSTAFLLQASEMAGTLALHRGEIDRACTALEQGARLYHPDHHALTVVHGHNPGVFCLGYLAMALALHGSAERALATAQQSLILATEVKHVYSRVCGLVLATWAHQLQGARLTEAQGWAQEAVTLAERHGFMQQWGQSRCLFGWMQAQLGAVAAGITEIERGLTTFVSSGAMLERPHLLGLLAEAYGKAQRIEDALRIVQEAINTAERTGECYYAPELYRLKGEFLLQRSRP